MEFSLLVMEFDPRILVIAIIAFLLAYWLLLPRDRSKPKASSPDSSRENSSANDEDKSERTSTAADSLTKEKIEVKKESVKMNELRRPKLDFEGATIELNKAQNEVRSLKKRLVSKDNEIALLSKEHEDALKKLKNEMKTVSASGKNTAEVSTDEQAIKVESFSGHKLVHLDLKGAPPKMTYLLKSMKLFKDLGATGMLVEYEDTYPYTGELEVLQAENAYSEVEITKFLSRAKALDLIVVPLVQTFGHLEFVLKHKRFAHIRETKEMTNALCPLHKDSVQLIKKLITDILRLHPDCKWIHLGGDEVWNLKSCAKCKANKMSTADLYLHHMKPLVKYVKEETNGEVKSIIWDDMMREWTVKYLKSIAVSVQPMVWAYVPDLENYHKIPDDMFQRYSETFGEIWVASSFKGADRTTTNVVPIKDRVANHVAWLRIMAKFPESLKVAGIALTGWSRFDHYGALCELLPAGIPSLALCLGVLYEGQLNERIKRNVSARLGLDEPFQVDVSLYNIKRYIPENFTFPGHEVHKLVCDVEKSLSWYNWAKIRSNGWDRPYQFDNYHLSFYHLNNTLKGAEICMNSLRDLLPDAKKILSDYFDEGTVKEWTADKIEAGIQDAKSLKSKTQEHLKSGKFH